MGVFRDFCRIFFFQLIVAVLLLLLSCGQPPDDEIVMQVGNIELTAKDVARYLKRHQQKLQKKKLTPSETKHYLTHDLIDHLLLLNAAADAGDAAHPEVLRKLQAMQKKYLTAGDGLLYRRFLADSLGLDEAEDAAGQREYQRHLENVAAGLRRRFFRQCANLD